ncbi:MAG: SLBB domain-containing protein [Ignavibacteriae bacterium]|nr:SLBB domain-containing protein [Ignavibacteriota bacterium]
MKKIRFISNLSIITILFFIFIYPNIVFSQEEEKEQNWLDNYFISGSRKKQNDTLAIQRAHDLAKESAGLQEKEIDPNKYILGPGDEFNIMVLGAKTLEVEATISPEGKLIIPEIGTVNLKGKTLAEADTLIRKQALRIFKNNEVNLGLKKLREFKVIVSGAVRKPGIVPATAVDRVSEVIEKAGGLKYNSSIRKISLYRTEPNECLKVDLLRFYMTNDKESNPTVIGGDHIVIPTSNIKESIGIYGEIGFEGDFEYVEGDSLSTLIKFGQGFLESSFLDSVEIARFRPNTSYIDRWTVNISSWRKKFDTASFLEGDFPLFTGDRVFIRQIVNWNNDKMVAITGEVNYPGYYAINIGETKVRDILNRAGGVTDNGALESALMIRKAEIQKTDPQMERLYRTPYSEMSENERRYFQAKIVEKKGMMAIDFEKINSNQNSSDNILVMDKDSIFVPQKRNFVNVQGRVNNPGMVIYNPNLQWLDYINLAGGFGFRADDGETLIVKPKGEQFLAENMNYTIEPGDNILVPPEAESDFTFYTGLTIVTQLVTIVGVILALTK